MVETIHIDRELAEELRHAYLKACDAHEQQFEFHGWTLYRPYARYLIQHLFNKGLLTQNVK